MKFTIKHESKGRLRVHAHQVRMTYQQADTLQYYLQTQPGVTRVDVYDRTGDATIRYDGDRQSIIQALREFCYDGVALRTVFWRPPAGA